MSDWQDDMWQLVDPMLDGQPGMFGPRLPIHRSGERETICVHVRELVYRRDNGSCRLCHLEWRRFEIDHIFPWSALGDSRTRNLQLLCAECNQAKSNRATPMPPRPSIVTACTYCNREVEHGEIRAWCARCDGYASVTQEHINRTDRWLLGHCEIGSWVGDPGWPYGKRPPIHVLNYWLDVVYHQIDERIAAYRARVQAAREAGEL